MFYSILILSLLIILIRCNIDKSIEWSSCSKKCYPGYTYHIQSNDQSIELRSCFEQNLACINDEYKKINEQEKILQENRRYHLSKILIQVIILLCLAIGFTIIISSISFIYLFRDTFLINSNYSIHN